MSFECFECKGSFWCDEKLSISTKKEYKFGMCCKQGKIKLPKFNVPPLPLQHLLVADTNESKTFQQHIRAYNSALGFASIGANVSETISGKGVYTFKIQESVYHRMGSLLPSANEKPSFAQICFHDTENETSNRLNSMSGLNESILASLQEMIHLFNPFYAKFKTCVEQNTSSETNNIQLLIRADKG